MKYTAKLTALFLCLFTISAFADTVHLKSGIKINGKIVKTTVEGNVVVEVQGRTMTYRGKDIVQTEVNSNYGEINYEKIRERAAKRQERLTEETGYGPELRKEMDELIWGLLRADYGRRMQTYEALKALHLKHNILPYLEYTLPQISQMLSPWVLEAMFFIDKKASKNTVVKYATDSYYGNRAMVMQLLTGLDEVDNRLQIIVRGLKDHKKEVVLAAIKGVALVSGGRDYTPALLELMRDSDIRVQHTAKEALKAIWFPGAEAQPPATREAWNAWWVENREKVPGAKSLDTIEPLILPDDEFVHG